MTTANETIKKVLDNLNSRIGTGGGVVSAWQSADKTQWYRKYADGWIEQGGTVSHGESYLRITFPLPFSSTNYFAGYALGVRDGSYVDIWNWTPLCDAFENGSMSVFVKDGGNVLKRGDGFWYACGY